MNLRALEQLQSSIEIVIARMQMSFFKVQLCKFWLGKLWIVLWTMEEERTRKSKINSKLCLDSLRLGFVKVIIRLGTLKYSIYLFQAGAKIHIFQKSTYWKSQFLQNSPFWNLIFHKIHLSKISFFTKFTFLKHQIKGISG